jgi:hypothetical protein
LLAISLGGEGYEGLRLVTESFDFLLAKPDIIDLEQIVKVIY